MAKLPPQPPAPASYTPAQMASFARAAWVANAYAATLAPVELECVIYGLTKRLSELRRTDGMPLTQVEVMCRTFGELCVAKLWPDAPPAFPQDRLPRIDLALKILLTLPAYDAMATVEIFGQIMSALSVPSAAPADAEGSTAPADAEGSTAPADAEGGTTHPYAHWNEIVRACIRQAQPRILTAQG